MLHDTPTHIPTTQQRLQGEEYLIDKYMTSWTSSNFPLRQTMAEDKPSGGFTHLSGPAGPGTASDENKDHCWWTLLHVGRFPPPWVSMACTFNSSVPAVSIIWNLAQQERSTRAWKVVGDQGPERPHWHQSELLLWATWPSICDKAYQDLSPNGWGPHSQ
jgi:hypothetical protein